MSLPYPTELEREAEWLELSDSVPTLQIPELLAAALEKETPALCEATKTEQPPF